MAGMQNLEQTQVFNLARKPYNRDTLVNYIFTGTLFGVAVIGAIPLFSVLYMLITRGSSRLNWDLFTQLPPAGFMSGGGIGNAIVGTLVMIAIACLFSVPLGVMGGVLTGSLAPKSRTARTVRFIAKVMSGFPSILAGVFVYALLVVGLGTYSALAGGIALAILMLPIILLTSEQAVSMVPQRMKDAAFGMGCTHGQVVTKVVLPTAMPAILTGIMLSIARAAGESAPLLFTALFSNFWIRGLIEPTASLSILIYNFSGMPFPNQIELAWAGSLVLVLIVFAFNVLSRIIGRPRY
ncbi:phosphate transport system permease protein PstA [Pseudovibrio japonicus]|uniref:Phosphate transport system permease protein PstA n=1 Tax=Pseudovibrio japonicus TaxID=366534 RepID=A0ABQ3EH94_9HYPH|nr:phosphate ABC transporter permease PstA [Pseudovibrio japonicus]GHB34620.1 phosphate transport system permease protein PstA [Pseudovibrio japonicus]